MTAGLYPGLTNARRSNFQAATAATHRTGYLKAPAVRWDMLDEATVTIECEAHDPSAAAETVRSIIRRNAEFVAQIGVEPPNCAAAPIPADARPGSRANRRWARPLAREA
jgi:hypothetical protein